MSSSNVAAASDLPAFTGVESDAEFIACDPDVALMLAAAAGSDRSFEELVERHQKPLVSFFHRMGAPAESQDLAQETFVRLYCYRRQYRPRARFTAFLYHLARNAWADFGRKAVRLERVATELHRQSATERVHPAPAPRANGTPDVETALGRLSPKLREVIVLNIYQGLRYQEVADVLEIPLGTVKSRINLAFAALKELLHET